MELRTGAQLAGLTLGCPGASPRLPGRGRLSVLPDLAPTVTGSPDATLLLRPG